MTAPAPRCHSYGSAGDCGAPAVATVIAACPNGHQGAPRPVCGGCLMALITLPLACFECHGNGRHRVPVNIMVGEVDR